MIYLNIKRIVIPIVCLCLIIVSIFWPKTTHTFYQTIASQHTRFPTIVIDAGHGGIDSGTSGDDGTAEKDINLAISKKLEQILRCMGFSVIMTRTQDDLISDPALDTIRKRKNADIMKRLEIANSTRNCVLISIHQNYFHQSQYSGAQVFYSSNHTENKELADWLQNDIIAMLQPLNTRKTKSIGSDVYLLHHCNNPAVMIECGFMSNPKELSLLKNESYQTKLAFTIALSLISFYT